MFSCSNELEDQEINLEVYYIDWACECANWIKKEDLNKFSGNIEKLAENCFYIEPIDESVILPDSLLKSGNFIKLKGKFYKMRDFQRVINHFKIQKKLGY
jgi:hypothetical protein